jgi:response regulator of citrate/malate metabolism
MNEKAITVMIVEDDEVAVKIYEQFAHKTPGYQVVASARTGNQALELLQVFTPDLILLDIYLPDLNGIDLMWDIRKLYRGIDIILITAANDTKTVSAAIRGGAFGYLIKPIIIEKFISLLTKYSIERQKLSVNRLVEQHEVDYLFRAEPVTIAAQKSSNMNRFPKGIDKHTLKLVRDKLEEESGGINADELARLVGTSHSTVRRYLEFLVTTGELEVDMVYGSIGRPERRYKRKVSKE